MGHAQVKSQKTQAAAERRARRHEARARVAALRERLREALAAKKARMRALTQVIRGERLALRDRLQANRKRVLEELREAARAERVKAREEWLRRRLEAKGEATSEVARARAELAAERAAQAAQRKIDRAHRADATAHARAARQQSDDEVRALIPRELVALFDRVKRSIRGGAAQTRAEAFLHYAEKHPEETFKAVDPRGVERLEAARKELEHATREAAKGETRNWYEQKQAARAERLRRKAARLEAASQGAHAQAQKLSDIIPMGQPILVGHHSEKRHRRDLKRIQGGYQKASELHKQAESLAQRADSVESNRAVSSDDPAAIDKLRAKLAAINKTRELMRATNAAIRAGGDVAGALTSLGFKAGQIQRMLEPDELGRVGVPDYALTNRGAEARRLERRIKELEARDAAPTKPEEAIGDARISEEDNRVKIIFPGKPAEPVRRALKEAGFRWARSVGAWQRHASNQAWYQARRVLAEFSARPT